MPPVWEVQLKFGKRNFNTGKIVKDISTQTEIPCPPVRVAETPIFIQCACKENCRFWLPKFPADYSVPKH